MTASVAPPEVAPSPAWVRRTTQASLQLCGSWRLSLGDHAVSVQPGEQRLLALLALRGPQPRAKLAGILWPQSSEAQARASLRSALWRVRKSMPLALTGTRAYLGLDAGVNVDANRLARVAQGLIGRRVLDPEAAGADFQLLVQTDELLPGWYDDWVLIERERLFQLRMHALDAYAERLAAHGRYADALEVAFTALATEPYRESPYQLIARIHLAEGNVHEAIRTFRLHHQVVVEEFGSDTGEQTPDASLGDVRHWLASD